MTYNQTQRYFYSTLSSFYSKNELASIWKVYLELVLKIDRIFFITNPQDQIEEEKIVELQNVINRLTKHEPIQYIIGKAWFCDSVFNVNPSVLIPRPETEELVYKVCENIIENNTHILDIGTGSGCIAISIKKIKPGSTVIAVDISEVALDLAASNATRILGNTSVSFINRDVLNPDFAQIFNIKFDLIVSNPPYIPEVETENIKENVLNFEPHLALFCGDDPLLFYKAITHHAKQLLKPGGLLFFEIHEDFGTEVKKLLIQEKFKEIELIRDMQNKNRIIKARYYT